jgi:hypothetical protein
MEQPVYVFLDEGGNFDFSRTGTPYFTMTGVVTERPFGFASGLGDLRHDLIEAGHDIEYFHAAEQVQAVRDRFFAVVAEFLPVLRIHSVVAEKRKTRRALQTEERFYPAVLGHLVRHLAKSSAIDSERLAVFITDAIPVQAKRRAVEKAIKTTVAGVLPAGHRYWIIHHASKSNYGLQIVDFCNWAIYRKWNSGDTRSYNLIKSRIESELDIFGPKRDYY